MSTARSIILLCAVCALPAGQIARAEEVKWRVTRTEHFMIYYAPGADTTAERAGAIAEKWLVALSRKLDFEPGGVTPIYLYPDRPSFAEATGVEPAEEVVGIAHTRTLKVRVDASRAFADIAHIIPHELVHVLVSRRLRGHSVRLPVWMHEGLAKYLAEDWTGPDAELLADAASGGEILRLDQISKVFPLDDRKRSVAYVQSYSLVKYMTDRYSPECIPDLFSELEAGHPFSTALFYSIGRKPSELEEEWRQYIWEEYNLNRWVKFGSGLISAAMALFVILAFRARIIAKRRKAEEMEHDWETG